MLEKSAKTLHDIVNDEKGKNLFLNYMQCTHSFILVA